MGRHAIFNQPMTPAERQARSRASGQTMRSTMRLITIALLTTLATLAPAEAQDVRFHDAHGRVTGSSRTDANGVTTFHDAVGRVTGTARTDGNGVTTFRDAFGRTTGSIKRER